MTYFYAQIDPATRVCLGVTQTSGPIDAAHMVALPALDDSKIGRTHDAATNTWAAAPAPAAAPRHLSKRAFRARFTKPERAAVEWAAVDKPEAPTAERMLSAQLRADLKDQEQADFIDLDEPDVLAGLQALEAIGILAVGRADAIHSAPVHPSEAP